CSKLTARYPSGCGKRGVEQTVLRYAAAVACPDDEKLAKIERRMPADGPPKRARDANTDTEQDAESENHCDVDCVFMWLWQVRAGKEGGWYQCRRQKTGPAPQRLQSVPAEDIFLSDPDEQHRDEPRK